ncbi:tumor necrosis factor receptor superfamily member 5-like isoform 1-T1 [Aulostomus maculatus]
MCLQLVGTVEMLFVQNLLMVAQFLITQEVLCGPALTCHPVEYESVQGQCCPKCLPGSRVKKDCTEFRSTSCLPCTEGTYMNKMSGLNYCLDCGNCDSGSGLQVKTKCTIVSDTVCEPVEGFYCLDSREDGCVAARQHTRCQPGQHISQRGTAFNDTVCTDCRGGTFADGTSTSCQPHTDCKSKNLHVIKAGTAAHDTECGEARSSAVTIAVVVSVVLLVFLLLAVGLRIYFTRCKRERPPREGNNPEKVELKRRGEENSGASGVNRVTPPSHGRVWSLPMGHCREVTPACHLQNYRWGPLRVQRTDPGISRLVPEEPPPDT